MQDPTPSGIPANPLDDLDQWGPAGPEFGVADAEVEVPGILARRSRS